ncbi:hypothetical protein FQR65_LT03369 [Abscondita terminalis]|nr:hypothetical protein FQR65_LT03369 [Abscondita terminalis]
MNKEQTEFNNTRETVVAITEAQLKNLSAIREKLKSLHGYEKNEFLRDVIQTEMEDTLKEIRMFSFDAQFLDPYQRIIQDRKDEYKSELDIIRTTFFNLKTNCIEPLANVPLTAQFERRLNDFEDFMEKLRKECDDNNLECKPFLEKLENLRDQSEYNLSGAVSKTIQDNLSNISGEEEQVLNSDYYIKVYEENSKLKIIDIENIKKHWLQDINEEEKIFNSNLKRISQLYKVKRDLEV